MEEQPQQKKVLFISPAVQVLIVDTPAASALLGRLEQEQGYELEDIGQIEVPDGEYIGEIVGMVGGDSKAFKIRNAEGLVQVLSIFLSPEKSNAAAHSPPASPAPSYQDDSRQLMRESGDGKSIDVEELGDGKGVVELRGFRPESKSFASWCNWFACCCGRDDESSPLLSTAPKALSK